MREKINGLLFSSIDLKNGIPVSKELLNNIDKLFKEELKREREKLIKEFEKLPTGMFDSTPYLEDLINKLK